MIKRLKQHWRRWQLRRRGVDVELSRSLEMFGAGSGAWTVDPTGLRPDSVVYSFGIGRDISFDLALISRFGLTVHAFDPTPEALAWVKKQSLPPSLVIHEYGLAGFDGEMEFIRSRRAGSSHYSPVRRYRDPSAQEETARAPVRRLATIMMALRHRRVDLLKVDIEGGEYGFVEDLVREPHAVRQIAVEFHHAYETVPLAQTVAAVANLRQLGFRLIHISARSYEMTFVHRSFAESR